MRCRGLHAPFALLVLGLGLPARTSVAEDPAREAARCDCAAGKGCWHYLRSPLRPPEDLCRCTLCSTHGTCAARSAPAGWGEECMNAPRLPCFFLRHAASWTIACSLCAASDDCGVCAKLPGAPDAGMRVQLERQATIERNALGKLAAPGRDPFVVAWSPHFYVVSDEQRHKLHTQGGGERMAEQHELLHLMLERSEKAYDDWVAAFGDEMTRGRIALYVTGNVQRREAWGSAFLDGPTSTSMYGDDPVGRMSGGFAGAGLPIPLDRRGDDRDIHAFLRHMLGHMFFSRWHGSHVDPTSCPPWASAAAAEWLERSDPLFADGSVYWGECNGEGHGASGSGEGWDARARMIAAGTRDPVGKLLGMSAEFHMKADDYVRAWSYFATMLREDRRRFVELMRALREGKDRGAAFEGALGCSPEEFDRRWAERLTGKRASMAESATGKPSAPADSVGVRLSRAKSPAEMLDVLRGLGHLADADSAEAVASAATTDSDAVRETVVRVLVAADGKAAIDWMRASGLTSKDPFVRAHVARALGARKDAPARTALEPLLADPYWLARANAAGALASIADAASTPALAAAAADSDPRATIAMADALATFGRAASSATPAVATGLKSPFAPVKLSAARALARIGTADAMDPLIDALETATGRLAAEFHAALKAISHETFGPVATTWRNWWRTQKARGIPKDLPPSDNPVDDRYAPPRKKGAPEEPTYYGRRLYSSRIVFVMDISSSMTTLMTPPEGVAKEVGSLQPGPRIEIAKRRLAEAIEKLPDRTKLNLVFFSSDARLWKPSMVSVGPNRKGAIDAVRAATPDGETNIFAALRAAFGLYGKSLASLDLDEAPDTIYFLTDGEPTRGELTDRPDLLGWVRQVNGYVKAQVHVIAMGNMNIDLDFLDRLALENGGETILLPDR